MGKMVSFKRPDGKSVQGYLAEPAQGAAAPGMVVIQEWWGMNEQIKGVADRLAKAGYRALVPDLYRGKVGVTGFCMGGALTLLAAVNVPEADAGVVWYGYPPLEYVDASKIKAPLLGHFATEDQAFPIAKVDELEKKLRDAKVKFEFHRYKAKHAFANETANEKKLAMLEYNPQAAELAWKRTLDFLAKQLK